MLNENSNPPAPNNPPQLDPTPKKNASRIFTLVTKSTGKSERYDLAKRDDQERFIANVVTAFHRKLKELEPRIRVVWKLFEEMRLAKQHGRVPRDTTLCGCLGFGKFCTEKLGVTRQAIYDMMGDYYGKRKAKKKQEQAKRDHKMKPLSKIDQRRRDDITVAAVQLGEAEVRGDAEAAAKAKDDIAMIIKAGPPAKDLFGDYDVRQEVLDLKREMVKWKKLILRLLEEIVKADDHQSLPSDLMRLVAAARKELAVDAKSFGLGSVQ